MGDPRIDPAGIGYNLRWNGVPPTISGLPGYILEERTDAKPTWKQLGPVRPGLPRTELTTADLSHTLLVDKKPGTYFYRVTAVNGVGTKSEPSAAVRVDYALDQAQSFISDTSNYPNPFDAKNGSTLITYSLKEPSDVQVRFYDGFGREVRENTYAAGSDPGGIQGSNRILWDGTDGSVNRCPKELTRSASTPAEKTSAGKSGSGVKPGPPEACAMKNATLSMRQNQQILSVVAPFMGRFLAKDNVLSRDDSPDKSGNYKSPFKPGTLQ